MSQYCDVQDLYSFGLPRGSLANPARLIDSVSITEDTFVLGEHGFAGGERVTFRPDNGGTLPSPLVEGTTYFALRVSDSKFKVEATLGGGPINLGTAGYLVLVGDELPLIPAIEWASAIIEDMCPAHIVPFSAPYPEIIKMTAAELAVGKLTSRQGSNGEAFSKIVAAAQDRLKRWSKGIPVRGTGAETRAGKAVAISAPYRDPRGWRTQGVI